MAFTPSTQNSYERKDFGNPVVQIVLLLIVLVLFSWFVLKPKIGQTLERRTEIKNAQLQLSNIEADQADLDRLVNDLNQASDKVAAIDEALPLEGRVSKVYLMIDSYVRSSGMSLAIISADNSTDIIAAGDKDALQNPYEPGRTLYTTTLTSSVTGTMEQFKNLLELIETSSRVLDVSSVEIVSGGNLDGSGTKFRITVKAYAYEYQE